MEPAYLALTLYVLWTLLSLLVMAGLRFYEMGKGNMIANLNPPLADNVPPLLARLSRVYGNAVENMAPFAAVIFVAGITANISIINPLAFIFLLARVGQSLSQLISNNLPWPYLRGAFFVTQIVLLIYWSIMILLAIYGIVGQELMPHEMAQQPELMPHMMK